MKLKTQGLSLKVPAQAITTIVVAALAYFGVELDPEVSAALGVVIGFVAGILAPAAPTKLVPAHTEDGYGLVELVVAVLLILILVFVLLRVV